MVFNKHAKHGINFNTELTIKELVTKALIAAKKEQECEDSEHHDQIQKASFKAGLKRAKEIAESHKCPQGYNCYDEIACDIEDEIHE